MIPFRNGASERKLYVALYRIGDGLDHKDYL